MTPRTDNALHAVLLQQLVTIRQASLKENGDGLARLRQAAQDLEELAKRIRRAAGGSADKEKRILRKRARSILDTIRDDFYRPDEQELEDPRFPSDMNGAHNLNPNSTMITPLCIVCEATHDSEADTEAGSGDKT